MAGMPGCSLPATENLGKGSGGSTHKHEWFVRILALPSQAPWANLPDIGAHAIAMNLLDILKPTTVKVPLLATDKRDAINELVDLLADQGLVGDAADLKKVVWERESQRSTGIGEGLAIPHGKTTTLTQLLVAIGRPQDPLDFASIDGKPVKLLVLLVSPPDKTAEHIQALGKISRLMADPGFRAMAYSAESSEELFELFKNKAQ